MKTYCVFLARTASSVDEHSPRFRRCYVEAESASSAVTNIAGKEPQYRAMGVELSDLPWHETQCA